jgi:hypothetical protein
MLFHVFAVSFTYASLFRLPGPVLLFMKLQTYRIDTMPLIRRRRISLTLKDMAQMSTTITADNLCPLHAECAICMSGDGTGDAVEVRGPPTARFEFMVGLVQWCIAARAGVHAGRGLVLVIFACKWGFGTFFSEDAELFYRGEEMQLVKQRAFKIHLKMGTVVFPAFKDDTYLDSERRATRLWTVRRDKTFSLRQEWKCRRKSSGTGSRASTSGLWRRGDGSEMGY